eukprot:2097722-Pyramimonas_sp.AAC.1
MCFGAARRRCLRDNLRWRVCVRELDAFVQTRRSAGPERPWGRDSALVVLGNAGHLGGLGGQGRSP